MSYRRPYTLQQVHDLICESEGRASPTTGADGHSVGLHADGRADSTNRNKSIIYLAGTIEESRAMNPADGVGVIAKDAAGVDSRFTSRADMVKAVYQGINSPAGQAMLQEFDADSTKNRVSKTLPLSTSVKNIERFTKSTGVLERGLVCDGVRLVVDRNGTGVHIQTAFPTNVHAP